MVFRRETMIALRARHQAYRIASDILYPHVDPLRPPEPGIPLGPGEGDRPQTLAERRQFIRQRRRKAIYRAAFAILVVIAVSLAFVTFIVVVKNLADKEAGRRVNSDEWRNDDRAAGVVCLATRLSAHPDATSA